MQSPFPCDDSRLVEQENKIESSPVVSSSKGD